MPAFFNRQLKDIQIQADLLLNQDLDSDKLSLFLRSAKELKLNMQNHATDEYISKLLNEIPDSTFDDIVNNMSTLEFFGFDIKNIFGKNKNLYMPREIVSLISSKYASIEFLLQSR